MKKLTSLQVLMLMSLALGSSSMYGKNVQPKKMSMQEQKDINEAVMLELKSAQDEQARVDVLTDLVALEPMVVQRIIEDESDLESTFNSIRNFVHKKNVEIENLNKQNVVSELEIARLAVELTDAQAILENTIAKQRAKHKHNHRYEQVIKDALIKAEHTLKDLSKKAMPYLNQVGSYVTSQASQVTKSVKKAMPKKKSKSKSMNASSQE